MEERYEPLKDLSSGNFGVARLAKDKNTGELVAVKYIERGKKVKPFCHEFSSFLANAVFCALIVLFLSNLRLKS